MSAEHKGRAPMKPFIPKIEVLDSYYPGYGSAPSWKTRGVFDNRRLYQISAHSEVQAALQGERERVRWERPWPTKAEFLAAIKGKPLDTELCSNCGQPGANSTCLDRMWCERSPCRDALEVARAQYQRDKAEREADDQSRREHEAVNRRRQLDEQTACAFHWRDGWFFRRLDDGSVQVMHRKQSNSEWLSVDLTISAMEWASIVCSVSAEGETAERWAAAQDFHGRQALAQLSPSSGEGGEERVLTAGERHELECLRARVRQIDYPCSPHCDGYLRELALRNTAAPVSPALAEEVARIIAQWLHHEKYKTQPTINDGVRRLANAIIPVVLKARAGQAEIAAYLFERDQALGPYDDSPEGDAERLESARAILALNAFQGVGAGDEATAIRSAVEGVLTIAKDRASRELAADPFSNVGIVLLHFEGAVREALKRNAAPSQGEPS